MPGPHRLRRPRAASATRTPPRPHRDAAAAETRIAESGCGTSSILPPRRANFMPRKRRCRPPPRWRRAPSAKFSSRSRAAARGDRAGPAARSPARTGNTAGRPGGFAIGAHRGFRKRHQRYSGGRARTRQHIEFHRRRAPCRPGRRGRPGRRQGEPPRRSRAPRATAPGNLDDHLQNSLAAGRRERGRHRARHLQDGDDAARQRQPAADASRWRIRASAARRKRPRKTTPTPPRRRPRRLR